MYVLRNSKTLKHISFRADGRDYPVGSPKKDDLEGYVTGTKRIPFTFYDPTTGKSPHAQDVEVADLEAEAVQKADAAIAADPEITKLRDAFDAENSTPPAS